MTESSRKALRAWHRLSRAGNAPSQTEIREATGLSRATLLRSQRQLQEAGLIEVIEGSKPGEPTTWHAPSDGKPVTGSVTTSTRKTKFAGYKYDSEMEATLALALDIAGHRPIACQIPVWMLTIPKESLAPLVSAALEPIDTNKIDHFDAMDIPQAKAASRKIRQSRIKEVVEAKALANTADRRSVDFIVGSTIVEVIPASPSPSYSESLFAKREALVQAGWNVVTVSTLDEIRALVGEPDSKFKHRPECGLQGILMAHLMARRSDLDWLYIESHLQSPPKGSGAAAAKRPAPAPASRSRAPQAPLGRPEWMAPSNVLDGL